MKALLVKTIFLGVLLIVYLIAAIPMATRPTTVANYVPNTFVSWTVVTLGGALLAAIAAQLGVTLATNGARSIVDRVLIRHFGTVAAADDTKVKVATWAYLAVIALIGLALLIIGLLFVWLAVDPTRIAVPEDAKKLTNAPEYIETQAKSIVTFAIAAAGLGAAVSK